MHNDRAFVVLRTADYSIAVYRRDVGAIQRLAPERETVALDVLCGGQSAVPPMLMIKTVRDDLPAIAVESAELEHLDLLPLPALVRTLVHPAAVGAVLLGQELIPVCDLEELVESAWNPS